MIVVSREGMHNDINHMHTRPQPDKLQKAHLFTQSRCEAGYEGRILLKVVYLESSRRSKRKQTKRKGQERRFVKSAECGVGPLCNPGLTVRRQITQRKLVKTFMTVSQ